MSAFDEACEKAGVGPTTPTYRDLDDLLEGLAEPDSTKLREALCSPRQWPARNIAAVVQELTDGSLRSEAMVRRWRHKNLP